MTPEQIIALITAISTVLAILVGYWKYQDNLKFKHLENLVKQLQERVAVLENKNQEQAIEINTLSMLKGKLEAENDYLKTELAETKDELKEVKNENKELKTLSKIHKKKKEETDEVKRE